VAIASRILAPLMLLFTTVACADDWQFWLTPPDQQLLAGPSCLKPSFQWAEGAGWECNRQDYAGWLEGMRRARTEHRFRIGYSAARYELPAFAWAQSSFIQPQMMVEDRYFYDPVKHRYTVDRYLDDLKKRYGGIDAVLIWPTYPNLGIDARNQLDWVRSMPGGVAGVRQMIADFHQRGVRVLFPMMLWDQGTRNPDGSWPEAIAKLMADIGADGINGDTEHGVAREFPEAADRAGHPLVFEPELSPPDEAVAYNLMNWGQYSYGFVPGVDRFKWIEPRHMVNVSDRWKRDKTNNLQFAFFNGVGWESWENIWGIWNGITPRDGEATRRVATIERAVASYLVSPDWEPFFPMLRQGVFASRWPLGDNAVWTIVNRNDFDVGGPQMEVVAEPGRRYFDLYHGVELQPAQHGERLAVSFDLEAKGFGAIASTSNGLDEKSRRLMAEMRALTARPLSSYSREWTPLAQQMLTSAPTARTSSAPPGMVRIPAGEFSFKVRGTAIEGVDGIGADVQYPWESSPRNDHEHVVSISPFWMDKYPVTNSQFKQFLDASRYHPQDDGNFLRDWQNGTYPPGWDHKPVTWVSREDAQAYAAWAGKRLPHEWEWQYAAQGSDGRTYPWGNEWNGSAVPTPDKDRTLRGPDDVGTHPKGASPFGVEDLVGNVWQWTDEFMDEHTAAAILRGGSYYQPQGSMWYFPQAYRLNEHGRLLLMAPSMDRSGAVGFRCVKDAN
jgi:iron(II)-dependent oxidoreductase